MKTESQHLRIARSQFANSGLTILDSNLLAAADPTYWPSTQQEMLNRLSPRSLVAAFCSTHPTATFFEFSIDGGSCIGVARNLANIEERILELTGIKASNVKPFRAGSSLHAETTRVPAMRQADPDEFASFDVDEFEKSLPAHDCHRRHEGLERIRLFKRYQASKANQQIQAGEQK